MGTKAGRPRASTPSVSVRMAAQRRRDTLPELLLRRELFRRGLRFRVDHPLPGIPRRRADVMFPRARMAVFVDGCFWHGCPEHATRPVSNAAWWESKLALNVQRDRGTDEHLRSLGWVVLRFWEHDDMVDAAAVVHAMWIEAVARGQAPPVVGGSPELPIGRRDSFVDPRDDV